MKKKIWIIIFIILLVVFLVVVFGLSILAENKRVSDKFIFNSWNKVRDEYNALKPQTVPKEPIPNTYIYFSDNKINFCVSEETSDVIENDEIIEEKFIIEDECNDYSYKIKKDKLIVTLSNSESIEYAYEFLSNDELVLIYKTEEFEFKFFYNASSG